MNIFEKIATFLFRLLAAWGVIMGKISHLGAWSRAEYSPIVAMPAVINVVGGILLFLFSRRLGGLFGRDLQ